MTGRGQTDTDAALAKLAGRYALAEAATAKLGSLLELLVAPDAPTAIHGTARAIDDHLADSLVALELDAVREARAAADLGSGAGLPGLALAIALPTVDFALVESNHRKCAFLERAVAECEVANASTVHARAESWAAGIGRNDLVTARALGPLDLVTEYAAPLLRVGGVLVVWRGRRDAEAEAAGARAAEQLGLSTPEIMPVAPYAGARNRHLYVSLKVTPTPPGFPRRPGVAVKRPLGARISPTRRPI